MAGKNKIALRIAYRKNNNMKSTAYSKYFPEVALKQTLEKAVIVPYDQWKKLHKSND